MRFKGTLTDWKDDRGFGFIEPAEGGDRVFCHIKAFDVRVRRPIAGDRVTYELGKDAQGRLTAIKVRPVGLEKAQYQSNRLYRNTNAPKFWPPRTILFYPWLIVFIGYAVWSFIKSEPPALITTDKQVEPAPLKPESATTRPEQSTEFRCDGRVYCSQMKSRAEAEFFIKNCPGTKMDGDNDGVPCENDSRF